MESTTDTPLPVRSTKHSAGYDFFAPCDLHIFPNQFTNIDTNIKFTDKDTILTHGICDKWVMLLFPRSSLGFKYGLRFANTICVIDQDYRDTIKVSLTTDISCIIKQNERFMQGIFVPYGTLYDETPPITKRTGGIGSTNP